MSRPLDRSANWRVTLIIAALAVVGLATGIKLFTSAFPEASIDFKLSRSDAAAKAGSILDRLGQNASGYEQVIVFDYDDSAKTYLEREIGLEKANRLMLSEVNVWRWKYRRFRPLQKEEYQVCLDPRGRLVGYTHSIEEGKEGSALLPEQARQAAVSFLRGHTALPLDQYTLVEEKVIERPKRKDHVLTWERQGFKAGEATYRAQVTVQGDQVGGFSEFLKIPEGWQRRFEEIRSHNQLLQVVATVFFVLLLLAMGVVLFVKMTQRQVRWRLPLVLGALMFGLQFLQGINTLPLWLIDFDTTETMASFLASSFGMILTQALGAALLVFLPVAAGEILYRENFPSKLSMRHLLSRRSTGTAEFMQASLTGYLFVLVHFGFLTAFYYYGRNLGFWSPADINYTNAVSTALPWITPLALSFNASLFEECAFRLFAIPFLKRYLKSTWLAILIPAFVWGFLHSSYPQQPSYVRGVEVGLIGVAAGWILVRYGILATLVWHYVVDAFLIGLFLFRSSSLYFQISGFIVVGGLLLPLLLAVGVYLRRRSFVDCCAWTNGAEMAAIPVSEAVAESSLAGSVSAPPPVPDWVPAPARWRIGAPVLLAVISGLLLYFVEVERFGSFAVFRMDAREATRRSDAFLDQLRVDRSAFRKTTHVVNTVDELQASYLYRQSDKHELNRIYASKLPGVLWKTRYFKPQEKEEYWVSFSVQGDFHNYRHLVDENAPGANLEKDQAVGRAVAYLRSAKGIDVTDWKLVTSESNKREKRTDYEFEWQDERDGIGQARFRVGVEVVGEEVQGFHKYLKVPEEWELKEKEQTLLRTLWGYSRAILFVAGGLLCVVLFAVQLNRRLLDWKTALRITAVLLPAIPILYLNSLPSLIGRYPSEFQYSIFLVTMAVGFLIIVLFAGAGIFVLVALAHSIMRILKITGLQIPGDWKERSSYVSFGVAWGYCLALVLGGLGRLIAFLSGQLGVRRSQTTLSFFQGADEIWPILSSCAQSWLAAPLGLAALICLVGVLLRYLPSNGKRLVVVGAGLLLASGGSVRVPADFLLPLIGNCLMLGALYFMAREFVGANLVAYGVWLFVRLLGPDVLQMLQQPESFYRWNGAMGLLIVLLPALYALYLRRQATMRTAI